MNQKEQQVIRWEVIAVIEQSHVIDGKLVKDERQVMEKEYG